MQKNKPPRHVRIPKGINAVTVYCQVKIMKNKMKKITIILYTNKNQLSTKTPHKLSLHGVTKEVFKMKIAWKLSIF